MIRHFHQLILIKVGEQARQAIDLPDHEIEQLKRQVGDVSESDLLQILDLLFQAEPAVKLSIHPKLAVEMVFLKYFQTPPALSIDQLIEGLDQLRGDAVLQPSIRNVSDFPDNLSRNNVSIQNDTQSDEVRQDSATAILTPAGTISSLALDGETLWSKVQAQVVEQRPSLAGFLAKSQFKSYQNNKLEIEVYGNEFILKSIQKHLGFLEQIASSVQGCSQKVLLTANIQDAVEKEEQKKKTDELKRQTLSHPMVAEAINLFDGKVIDVKLS